MHFRFQESLLWINVFDLDQGHLLLTQFQRFRKQGSLIFLGILKLLVTVVNYHYLHWSERKVNY